MCLRMVLNCISSTTMKALTHRAKLLAKSLIFLILLALAGIGIATGSEYRGHDSATVRTVTVVGGQDREFRVGTVGDASKSGAGWRAVLS
jgi:hypothetical protein